MRLGVADWKFNKKQQELALRQSTKARQRNQCKQEPPPKKKQERYPGSIFPVQQNLTPEQAKALRDQWVKNHNWYSGGYKGNAPRTVTQPQGAAAGSHSHSWGTTGPSSPHAHSWGTTPQQYTAYKMAARIPFTQEIDGEEPINERTCMWCAEGFDSDEALEEHEDCCGV